MLNGNEHGESAGAALLNIAQIETPYATAQTLDTLSISISATQPVVDGNIVVDGQIQGVPIPVDAVNKYLEDRNFDTDAL